MWTIMQKNNEATGEILDTENTQDISVSLKRQFAWLFVKLLIFIWVNDWKEILPLSGLFFWSVVDILRFIISRYTHSDSTFTFWSNHHKSSCHPSPYKLVTYFNYILCTLSPCVLFYNWKLYLLIPFPHLRQPPACFLYLWVGFCPMKRALGLRGQRTALKRCGKP